MVPLIGATGEQKTKPCQHSVKLLREAGLSPNLLMCRCEQPIEEGVRQKLSLFCQVPVERVVSLHDVSNIYRVPLVLTEQDVGRLICEHFGFKEKSIAPTLPLADAVLPKGVREVRLGDWRVLADREDCCKQEVTIAVVGKYTNNPDAYLSVVKALKHAALEAAVRLSISWVESSELEANAQKIDAKRHSLAWERLREADGVLVPGGFGNRGVEGKVLAAGYCRKNLKPYFGICIGFQTAVIEFAREVVGWEAANSTEFDESTEHPVVVFLPESSTTVMGGTMRLGSRATIVRDRDSLGQKLYGGSPVIYERHRHRYEVNAACVPVFESHGLRFTGQDDRAQRMELCELSQSEHPFYVACQFHPEFKTHPARPAPLFSGLILASAGRLTQRLQAGGGNLRVGSGFEE